MISKFGPISTADDVLADVDLIGKRILVTGVSSGIGVETARAFAAHGAAVVGAARNLAKAKEATAGVRAAAEQSGSSLELVELDLASLLSVRACAERLIADGRRFDVVIANAGVMATPLGRTADGFETQFGTNHLGHFVLVNRIAELISDNGRLVNLSSNGHRFADIDLADPNFEHTPYDPWVAYGRSKTANVLFAVEFDRRHRSRGVRATALMPGVSQTGLAQNVTPEAMAELKILMTPSAEQPPMPAFAFKTLQQVAATSAWAAVVAGPEEIGSRYLQDCGVAILNDVPGFGLGVRSYALDPERAKLLWAKSEELVGERY
jgi:NAD(P)-dependent dehydrogenase (short-subunit alcohol dehydrogenase family)